MPARSHTPSKTRQLGDAAVDHAVAAERRAADIRVAALQREHAAAYTRLSAGIRHLLDAADALRLLVESGVRLTNADETLDAVHKRWLDGLDDDVERRLLWLIIEHGRDRFIARSALAERIGYAARSPRVAHELKELHRLGAIEVDGKNVRASALLFPEGAK